MIDAQHKVLLVLEAFLMLSIDVYSPTHFTGLVL